ncbi:MAG: radical SAM protein [Deltaproteobacteria bacterium]|nr:radical SAM protein [Deltaproteobacteria bacterium]
MTNLERSTPSRWRAHDLDGEVLLFDRATGTNLLVTTAATAGLRRRAPRTLQVALTNACDKSCAFCYRPREARSRWTFDGVLALARTCDAWGVLELAFGGGEPTLFPRFAELLRAIWTTTGLCPSFTTHGKHLTAAWLRGIRGHYGQIQLSVYEDEDTGATIDLLVGEGARFGLNYLVTPDRVRTLEADVVAFAARGVRDILLLSYKGPDRGLHLGGRTLAQFDASVAKLHRLLGATVALKVDVCWANRLVQTPQLVVDASARGGDCGANVEFLSLSSDLRVLPCSFATDGIAFADPSELPAIWASLQTARIAAPSAGCARLPRFGLPTAALPVIA